MIITANEYKEMGFDATDNVLLEKCIKRAEFVLNGITGGRATLIALGTTLAADFVKQAAAFQTNVIYREETALLAESSESSEQSGSSSKTDERVTIGDFTYSTGTSSSSSREALQEAPRRSVSSRLTSPKRLQGCCARRAASTGQRR